MKFCRSSSSFGSISNNNQLPVQLQLEDSFTETYFAGSIVKNIKVVQDFYYLGWSRNHEFTCKERGSNLSATFPPPLVNIIINTCLGKLTATQEFSTFDILTSLSLK